MDSPGCDAHYADDLFLACLRVFQFMSVQQGSYTQLARAAVSERWIERQRVRQSECVSQLDIGRVRQAIDSRVSKIAAGRDTQITIERGRQSAGWDKYRLQQSPQ